MHLHPVHQDSVCVCGFWWITLLIKIKEYEEKVLLEP